MKKIGIDFIPLFISIILVVITIIKITTSNSIIDYHHYVGISLLTISTVLYFYKKEYSIYIFGLTLLVGIFGLVKFFYATIEIGFGNIGINIIFLTLFVLYLTLNKSKINEMFPEKEPTESEKENLINESENLVKSFEQNFSNKTENELKEIIDENSSYVSEAKIAAEKILNGKKYVL